MKQQRLETIHAYDAMVIAFLAQGTCPAYMFSPRPHSSMPDKRHISDMDAAEIRVLFKDAKRRVALLEKALQDREKRICTHYFVEQPVNGHRDNGEREYTCSKCGHTY